MKSENQVVEDLIEIFKKMENRTKYKLGRFYLTFTAADLKKITGRQRLQNAFIKNIGNKLKPKGFFLLNLLEEYKKIELKKINNKTLPKSIPLPDLIDFYSCEEDGWD